MAEINVSSIKGEALKDLLKALKKTKKAKAKAKLAMALARLTDYY